MGLSTFSVSQLASSVEDFFAASYIGWQSGPLQWNQLYNMDIFKDTP